MLFPTTWKLSDKIFQIAIGGGEHLLRWDMFSEIHQLKQIGLKKAQVARKLEINVKTVSKYWEATPDEFAAMRQGGKKRSKAGALPGCDLEMVANIPDITCSQILDWIKEHYDDYSVCERTLRRYVNHLRQSMIGLSLYYLVGVRP